MALVDSLLSLLAPHRCLACGSEGSLLCAWCKPEACVIVPSRCYSCAAVTKDFATCHKCRRSSPLKHVWVASEYEGIPKQLIHDLKFANARAASAPIADLMMSVLPYFSDLVVVHVPTATSRRRRRGYDQAELLAKRLSRQLNLKHMTLLTRLGHSRQVGANRAQRKQQLVNSYAVITKNVSGMNILLIDDIMTTGATLESAARTLHKAGAKSVSAAVFAQKK